MANKLDPQVRFTENACKKLAGVPQLFLDVVLGGLIAEAKLRHVEMVDAAFVDKIEASRQSYFYRSRLGISRNTHCNLAAIREFRNRHR